MGKTYALVFGWVLLILGVLGFFPNPIIGGSTGAWLVADTNHNLVHLVSGLILLWAGYMARAKSGSVLKVLGVVYLLVAILGFVLAMDGGSILGLVETNSADHYFHLVLGVLLLWTGVRASKRSVSQSM